VPIAAAPFLAAACRPALLEFCAALADGDDDRAFRAALCFSLVPQFSLVAGATVPPAQAVVAQLRSFVAGEPLRDPLDQAAPGLPADEQEAPEQPLPDFLSERHRKAVKTAVFLAREGHYRRAVKILDEASQPGGGLAAVSPDTLARLQALHPDASGACPDVPGDAPIHLLVTNRILKTALKMWATEQHQTPGVGR